MPHGNRHGVERASYMPAGNPLPPTSYHLVAPRSLWRIFARHFTIIRNGCSCPWAGESLSPCRRATKTRPPGVRIDFLSCLLAGVSLGSKQIIKKVNPAREGVVKIIIRGKLNCKRICGHLDLKQPIESATVQKDHPNEVKPKRLSHSPSLWTFGIIAHRSNVCQLLFVISQKFPKNFVAQVASYLRPTYPHAAQEKPVLSIRRHYFCCICNKFYSDYIL